MEPNQKVSDAFTQMLVLRVLFIRWLLSDRNITREELRIRSNYSKSKIDKVLSLKGYKSVTTKVLDDIEHHITVITRRRKAKITKNLKAKTSRASKALKLKN